MKAPLRILAVEDSDFDAELLAIALRRETVDVTRARSMAEAKTACQKNTYDVVLLDLSLPDSRGIDTFRQMKTAAPLTAIVVLSGNADETLALQAVHEGAQDSLEKSHVKPLVLSRAIRYACERKRLQLLMTQYTHQLQKKNAELSEDLRLAREMQQAFLPSLHTDFTSATTQASLNKLGLHCRYASAGMVGGDFVEFLRLPEDRVGVLISDVMGHGVRAALVTSMLRALVSQHSASAHDPGKMLGLLNQSLRSILSPSDETMFASAFYLVVELASGDVAFSNAGHPRPLWLRAETRTVETLSIHGQDSEQVLGLIDWPEYRAGHLKMKLGDRILLFTDGVYERDSEVKGAVGAERLAKAVNGMAHRSTEQLVNAVWKQWCASSPEQPQRDDACLVAVDFTSTRLTRERGPVFPDRPPPDPFGPARSSCPRDERPANLQVQLMDCC